MSSLSRTPSSSVSAALLEPGIVAKVARPLRGAGLLELRRKGGHRGMLAFFPPSHRPTRKAATLRSTQLEGAHR